MSTWAFDNALYLNTGKTKAIIFGSEYNTNEENINSLVNTLGVKISDKCKIEEEQINKPKLKVIDIDMDNADDNEIELDGNQRNFS